MPKHKHKNAIDNKQGNISPPEPNNLTTGPEKCILAKAKLNLKISFVNVLEVLKDDMNETINENLWKHKQWNEIKKTVQYIKVEIETIKKT